MVVSILSFILVFSAMVLLFFVRQSYNKNIDSKQKNIKNGVAVLYFDKKHLLFSFFYVNLLAKKQSNET